MTATERAWLNSTSDKHLFSLLITDLQRLSEDAPGEFTPRERANINRRCLQYALELRKRGVQLKLVEVGLGKEGLPDG
jgi:hypothetical protein